MSIIQTRIHTFAQALACKRANETLSPTTLKKLTKIANREFGGNAEHVFSRSTPGVPRFRGDAHGLRSAIASQLTSVRSPGLQKVMTEWLGRLPFEMPHAKLQVLSITDRSLVATVPDAGTVVGPTAKHAAVAAWLTGAQELPIAGYESPNESVRPACEEPPPDYRMVRIVGTTGDVVLDDTLSVLGTRISSEKTTLDELVEQFMAEGPDAHYSPAEKRAFWEAAVQIDRSQDKALAAILKVASLDQFDSRQGPLPSMAELARVLSEE